MKVLLYVDAENVYERQLGEYLREFDEYRKSYETYGRFYGDRTNIGNVFNICLSYGLDFVETSCLSPRRKNLADSKIIVDVMYDVFCVYKGDIAQIMLISNDADFMPLVHKLSSVGISVNSYLQNRKSFNFSMKDVTKNLFTYGFYPISNYRYFSVPFVEMREMLPAELPDDLIVEYLSIRWEKFLSTISLVHDKEVLVDLKSIDIHEISAREVLFRLDGLDMSMIRGIMMNYFQRIFGSTPKGSLIDDFIKR